MSKEAEAFDVEGLRRTASIVDAYHLCESSDKIVAAADHIEALEKRVRELEGAIKYASKNCIAIDGHTEESCGTELTYLEIESSEWTKHQRAIQKLRKLIQKEPNQ